MLCLCIFFANITVTTRRRVVTPSLLEQRLQAGGRAGDAYLQMILSVRMMRLVMPLFSFLLIWSATHTGVSGRARVTGVSPSRFMMSMSAPLDRNNLAKTKKKKETHSLILKELSWWSGDGFSPAYVTHSR